MPLQTPHHRKAGRTRHREINDIEPYAYLNYLFEHLPMANTVEQVEALLPWSLKAMRDEQKKISSVRNPPPEAAPRPT